MACKTRELLQIAGAHSICRPFDEKVTHVFGRGWSVKARRPSWPQEDFPAQCGPKDIESSGGDIAVLAERKMAAGEEMETESPPDVDMVEVEKSSKRWEF